MPSLLTGFCFYAQMKLLVVTGLGVRKDFRFMKAEKLGEVPKYGHINLKRGYQTDRIHTFQWLTECF